MMRHSAFLFLLLILISCTGKKPQGDKALHLHIREPLRSFDPVLAQDMFSQQMVLQVYEGLYHYNYYQRPMVVEPQLAESLPEVSSDGLVYTFKIKKNIFFQNDAAFKDGQGREVTAQDFIYSWLRLADPQNKSENYWIFRDKIKGYNEWREKRELGEADYDTPVAGLQAKDKYTLKLVLNQPHHQLLYQLTTAATAVVPREVVEAYGAEFGARAVGTGAYKLQEWIRNSKITFVKNEKYREEYLPRNPETEGYAGHLLNRNSSRLPLVDKVIVFEITEEQPQWLLFKTRELDLWRVTTGYQRQMLESGRLKSEFVKKKIQIEKPINADITFVGFNTENPFLKNTKVRQALALAYDQSLVMKKFYNSTGTAAHGPIPPPLLGYRQNAKNEFQIYNLEKAKQMLAEAGYPEGQGLPVFVFQMSSTHATARQMAEFFKEQVKLIGVHIQLQPNTWAQFNEKLKTKNADIFEMAWNADYPDAENFLQLFYSKNRSPGPNSTNFSHPVYDQLYERALNTPSVDKRVPLYHQMEDILMAEVPCIFNFHRIFLVARQPWLKNIKSETMILDTFKYYDIDIVVKNKFYKDHM